MGSVIMPWSDPQVTRAGRIKIGRLGPERTSRGGKPWRPPVKLDRILITKDERDSTGNFAIDVEIMTALGAPTSDTAVTEIPIEVHSDEVPDVLVCKLVRYTGKSQLACSGDGVRARERCDGGWRVRECPCPRSTLVSEEGDCKPNAVFSCSLRLPGHRTIGAVYEFRTTSAISIRRLAGSLGEIKRAIGTLVGLPLTMALREVGLAGKAPVYCMHVELREQSVEEAQRYALQMAQRKDSITQLIAGREPRYLPAAPGFEEPAEAVSVVQEFYPEVQHTETTSALDHDISLPPAIDDEEPPDDVELPVKLGGPIDG